MLNYNLTISVIIPCFNNQNTIIRAINSVIKQTQKINEIIIIDDGSSDNSKTIVKAYIQNNKEANIIYLSQTNKGSSNARNTAVKQATSDYIAFLDADDTWHIKKIAIQTNILKKHQLNFIGATYQYDNFTENTQQPNIKQFNFRQLLIKNRFSTPGVVIKKKLFEEIGGFDEQLKYAEDYDLWLRLSLKDNLTLIDKPPLIRLYKAAYGESGLSANLFNMFLGELKILKKHLNNHNLNHIQYYLLVVWIIVKFIRRRIKSWLKKYSKNNS